MNKTTNGLVNKAIDTAGASNMFTSETAIRKFSPEKMYLKIWQN